MTPIEVGYLSGTPDMDADMGRSFTVALTQRWLHFDTCRLPILAYDAHNTPIELLREIPGFVELKND